MLSDLLDYNTEWANKKQAEDPEYFLKRAPSQSPEYLWIGCADSRVPPNTITGLEPGEVFVHRNIANLVHASDLSLLSVLEYAVEALKVKNIIVCGHYGCGGVAASVDGQPHGIVDHWLQPIRDAADNHAKELEQITDNEQRLNRLCELNVKSQVTALSRTPIVQSAWKQGNELNIYGWIYGLKNGLLRDLDCQCCKNHSQS